jgi:hypothetical protein
LDNADRLFWDWPFVRLGGVAVGVEDREARYGYCLASQDIPEVLDVKSSARQPRTAGNFSGSICSRQVAQIETLQRAAADYE